MHGNHEIAIYILCTPKSSQRRKFLFVCVGLLVYATGILLIVGYFTGLHANFATGITIWLIAIGTFLIGHKLEGDLRAMTLIIFFKYLRSRKGRLARL
jgi:hypothetical protein